MYNNSFIWIINQNIVSKEIIIRSNSTAVDFALLKNGKLNEAIYFFQSGNKVCEVPNMLVESFPEFTENRTLLV